MPLHPVLIRRLGLADHAGCVALSVDRGWAPEERNWAFLLAAAEAYGIDAPDGDGLAASAVLARYGATQASVGMMLVAHRYSRRGLGQLLLSHLLGEAGDATVFLTATDAGRPLYEKLGFRQVRRNARFTGCFCPEMAAAAAPSPAAALASRPAADDDFPAILDADLAAFGADRGFLLRRLPDLAADVRVLEGPAGGIVGYGGRWLNGDITIIGPLVASNDAGARLLFADLAAHAPGPVRLDLDPARPGLPGWAAAHGVPQVGENAFMARGTWPPPGRRDRLYAPLAVAVS